MACRWSRRAAEVAVVWRSGRTRCRSRRRATWIQARCSSTARPTARPVGRRRGCTAPHSVARRTARGVLQWARLTARGVLQWARRRCRGRSSGVRGQQMARKQQLARCQRVGRKQRLGGWRVGPWGV
jgi:hypothetical protein